MLRSMRAHHPRWLVTSALLAACSSDPATARDGALDSAADTAPLRDAGAEVQADLAPPYEPEFQERFDAILATLLATYWSADGDWQGDMQGDATAFAPRLLYTLGAGDPALWDRAAATARHELDLVKALAQTGELNMEAVIGFPALADCYAFEKDGECKLWLTAGTIAGHQLIDSNPEALLPFVFDMATVFGTGSYICLVAAEALGDESLLQKGLALIARADAEHWDEAQGLYSWSQVIDWPQATMMMALTRAYRATGEQKYLDRCERILAAMKDCCWDAAQGGYYGHWGKDVKGLSGNNNMLWALLDLYESTAQEQYLETARAIIRWILSEDLYSQQTGLLHHHWAAGTGATAGRADSFCTGCNFESLVNIHRYHQLMAVR